MSTDQISQKDQITQIEGKISELMERKKTYENQIEYLERVQAQSGDSLSSHQHRELEENKQRLDDIVRRIGHLRDRRAKILAEFDGHAYARTDILEVLRVIVGLQAPLEGQESLYTERPEGLAVLRAGWLEDLIEGIRDGLFLDFDLRKKVEDDDPQAIEEWKSQLARGDWRERRTRHRLRIRTMVDDLFENSLPLAEVRTSIRAWKIQIADRFAEAVLERFHVRPASTRTWATYRLRIYDIGQELEKAIGYKEQLLRSEKFTEAKLLEVTIGRAFQATRELVQDLMDRQLSRQQK